MKKIVSCIILVLLLGLTSCDSPSGDLNLSVENGHFIATPAEIITYLNTQNENTGFYPIPDFDTSGEKIAICGDGEPANIYFTIFSDENGGATSIELDLYTSATEENIESFTQYLTLLLDNTTKDSTQVSYIMECVVELTSSNKTEVSFLVYTGNDIGISGASYPGFYTIRIQVKDA